MTAHKDLCSRIRQLEGALEEIIRRTVGREDPRLVEVHDVAVRGRHNEREDDGMAHGKN